MQEQEQPIRRYMIKKGDRLEWKQSGIVHGTAVLDESDGFVVIAIDTETGHPFRELMLADVNALRPIPPLEVKPTKKK